MKKYIGILKTGVAAFVLLIASSCDNWMDDNLNPSLVTTAPPGQILASVIGSFGFHMGGSDLYRYGGIWSQQITAQAARQTQNYSLYNLSDTEVNGIWRTNLYGGILADCEQLLKADPATTHPRYYGIAKVIKAFTYSQLVDFWGDVPFTEAMQFAENFQPAVDDDAAIYPQLLTMLDEAIVHLKEASSLAAPTAQDFIYTGNASKWIKAANVLKLRLYLKLANTPGFNNATIATFLSSTPANELFESNADDLQHPFTAGLSGRQNPTHQFILSRTDDICTSSTIINLMNTKLDPRRVNYFTPAPFSRYRYNNIPVDTAGAYIGLQPGAGQSAVNNTLSRLHRFVRGAVTTPTTDIPVGPNLTVSTAGTSLAYDGGAPVNILTFAEYNFIRAEIALRYSSPNDLAAAQTWYQAGIRASIADASHAARPLTVAHADAYVTNNGTLNTDQAIALRQIIEEKYVANFLVTGEPWSDWRRTGYPLLQLLPGTLNPGNGNKVPRTVVYPQQEVNANPNLTLRADMNTRVFWDTRTTGQE